MSGSKNRRGNRASLILSFMGQHLGTEFSALDIAQALHWPGEEGQTGTTLSGLVAQGRLESTMRGRYVMRHQAPVAHAAFPMSKLFEYVGDLEDGTQIAKDPDTNLLYSFRRITGIVA